MKHVSAPVPQEFRDRVPAEAGRLVGLRKQLAEWLAGLGVDGERREDIVLASNEALANSAEHAYREGDAGPIDVRAEELNGRLTVTVTDYGTWQPPVPTNGLRGRGLLLIDSLADHSAKVHREDGTTVTMTWLRNGAAAV